MTKVRYRDSQKCRKLGEFGEPKMKKKKICACGDHTDNESGICEDCEFLNQLEKEGKQNGNNRSN
jgi:hypothetical protein